MLVLRENGRAGIAPRLRRAEQDGERQERVHGVAVSQAPYGERTVGSYEQQNEPYGQVLLSVGIRKNAHERRVQKADREELFMKKNYFADSKEKTSELNEKARAFMNDIKSGKYNLVRADLSGLTQAKEDDILSFVTAHGTEVKIKTIKEKK